MLLGEGGWRGDHGWTTAAICVAWVRFVRMSLAGTSCTVVGGGIAGGILTYGLTWLRERRRLIDAYRAPHREAISVIIVATHELLAREADFRQAMNDLANESEGKPETDQARSHLDRALLG